LTVSPAESYLWSNGETTQSVVITASGSYTVTTTNGGVCSTNSNTIEIEVVDFFVFYADNDMDGFGDINSPVEGCELTAGLSINSGDCDDTNSAVNPDLDEICDGLDNNCDDVIDEGCPEAVLGCIDAQACNYNALATEDDGSCTYPGCTDAVATNYDPTAGCDDGSCAYVEGCTDSIACNFDPMALIENNTCTYPGCTDSNACNYDALAGCDDGSCLSPGCTDSTACNYNALAGCDDGSCLAAGCTDTDACNYNANASCDDGSCSYLIGDISGPQIVSTGGNYSYTFPCDAGCEYLWTVSYLNGTDTLAGFVLNPDDVCEVQIAWDNYQGIATIQLEVSCDNGCSSTYEYNVQLSGITEVDWSNVSLYPNPTLNRSKLEVPEQLVGSTMQIYNSVGSLVQETTITGRVSEIDASTWAAGVYSVLITDGDEAAVRLRLIKE
jgi:hypothetical protein